MSMTRITEFQASEENTEALFDFLKSLIPYIVGSAGCLVCEVLRSHDRQEKFVVIEKWESIDSHKKSVECFP